VTSGLPAQNTVAEPLQDHSPVPLREAKTGLGRSTAMGLIVWHLERLAFHTGHRQAADRDCLAVKAFGSSGSGKSGAASQVDPISRRTFANSSAP